jgi:hypothetical protein
MYRAFPGPEYYNGSAAPATFDRRRIYPTAADLAGRRKLERIADVSHVHWCPVDELGIRLYPCGIATTTP